MILIQKQRIFSIAGILLCVLFGNQKPIAVNAAKPSIDQAVATPYFMRNSERIGDRRVDATSGITLAWYNLDYTTNHANPINSALQFLSDQAENFGGEEVVANLSHTTIKSGLSGNHLHFQQHYQHIPVFQATVNVSLDKSNAVRMVTSNLHDNFALPSTTPTLTASEAIQLGRQVIGYSGKEMADPSSQLYGFRDQKRTDHLVWVVNLYPYSPAGDWTIIVDANDGSVLEIQDNAIHENGSGMIFNPDPLTTAEANYAGNYRDFNDQDNEELNAERYLVNLLNITETDGIYTLDGPWVRIFDFEEPIDPPVTAIHPDSFIFTRSESGFEDVNVYYHLDYAQRHLQALGFNNIQNAPILVDPHGLDGQDQSHYLGGMNRLAFGEGGVDDAEDADVIYHEYGHAIQYDQVPNWGGGHCGAMGEGFGDYWAGTFSARLSDYRNNWVFNWDGHNAFWNGRVLDYNGVYPDDWLGGFDIHHDGQIWSACLWEIREQIGADIMDAIVIDHHFYLNRNATVEDAAQALLLVDEINYDGLYQTTIGQACYDRGFINEVPIFGAINGHVQDAANDNPLQAQITLTQDDQTYTIFSNEEGYFFYSPLSVGFWDVESLVDGFSPWNETVEIAEDDTLDLTIYMGQPLLEMEDELLELEMYIDSELDTFLILENVGSGMAAWNFRFRQQGVAEIEPWELETQISISDACGETQLQGSTVAGGNIIISGANNGQNPNKLYFFDYTGEYLQEIDQPTSSAFGFRDLTTIEGKIYGSENVWIIGIDENGEVIDSIHGIHNPNRALAYDPDRDWIWIGNDRADIVAINRAGEEQVRFEQDYHVFALGYNPADPDDKPLYLFHWDDGGGLANAVVSKMDVETGEIVQETLIAQDDPNNIILGAEVVSDLEGVDGYWVAPVLIMNSAENLGYLHLHKVETAVPMLRGIPMHGTIQVDDSDNPLLHLNSEGVTAGNYRGTIDVQYNGVDSPMSRNFVLRVVSVSTESESPKLPQKFTMSDPYPNPFNSTIQVNYSVPNPAEVKVKIYNLQGQLLYNASHDVNAGNHNFVWHANTNKGAEVASGIYLLQVSSADFISTGKIVLIR